MKQNLKKWMAVGIVFIVLAAGVSYAQQSVKTSYSPVVILEPFSLSLIHISEPTRRS